MRDWLRFSVAYWHTHRGRGVDMFGAATRRFNDGADNLENAVIRLRGHFELMDKLDVDYFCFHDRDIAPEGSSLSESDHNLDVVVSAMKQLLVEHPGKRPLWGTANLFNHPRYMNGALTNPDFRVFAVAAAQVKKCMDVCKDIGAEHYLFWGGRDGYQSLLNTDMSRELDHMGRFLRLTVEYKQHLGFGGGLLIEPKPCEPMKHQYDFDAASVIGFLKAHGLDRDFKLNIEANHATLAGHTFEHELTTASINGMLGSVDANTGDPLLGWDTDQFNFDISSTAQAMRVVVKQGGLVGGLNFDAKLRRESIDVHDLFVAHVGSIDAFARGLRVAARMQEDGTLDAARSARYATWSTPMGMSVEAGGCSLQELSAVAHSAPEPPLVSARQEEFELRFQRYW